MLGRLRGSSSAGRVWLAAAAQPVASTSKLGARQRAFCSCGAALLHSLASGRVPAARTERLESGAAHASRSFPKASSSALNRAAYHSTASDPDLAQIQQFIDSRDVKQLRKSFDTLPTASQLALNRTTFDALLPLLTTDSSAGTNWRYARKLMQLAKKRHWSLEAGQLIRLLDSSVRWAATRQPRTEGGTVAPIDWPLIEAAAEQLAEAAAVLEEEARQGAARLLARLAVARLRRVGSTRSLDGEPASRAVPSTRAAAFAMSVYKLSLSLADTVLDPMTDQHGTLILGALFPHYPRRALTHLRTMLSYNRIFELDKLRDLLINITAITEADPYAHAREVLDSACARPTSRGGGELDSLLEERLKRLEQEEAIAREPVLAFIRWLVEDLADVEGAGGECVAAEEGMLAGLSVWQAVFGQGEWHHRPRFENLRALEHLVKDACALQASAGTDSRPSSRPPLESTRLAVELAGKHLTPPMLVNISHRIINATAVHSKDVELAMSLYGTLRTRCSAASVRPFQWHTALRVAFAHLILAADVRRESQTVLQLYLDWTGDGLVLPADLWRFVWQAAGRRSNVEEVQRLVNDYEEQGRGKVPARIVARAMRASAQERRIVKTLRLLSYWRSRERTVGELGGGRSAVPLEAYESVLELLSTSHTDRRSAGMNVFQQIIDEGILPTTRTWNFLLAAQVFRPQFHLEDVDNAGRAFNSLVGAGCKPDARTYSLLAHGFLRLARSSHQKSAVGLHAALKTFHKAQREGFLLRGEPVAGLMKQLARAGLFEDAKEVNEAWWRALDGGRDDRSKRGEMRVVRSAFEAVEWIERKALASADAVAELAVAEQTWPETQEEVVEQDEARVEGEEQVDRRSAEAFGAGAPEAEDGASEVGEVKKPFSFTSARPGRKQ